MRAVVAVACCVHIYSGTDGSDQDSSHWAESRPALQDTALHAERRSVGCRLHCVRMDDNAIPTEGLPPRFTALLQELAAVHLEEAQHVAHVYLC